MHLHWQTNDLVSCFYALNSTLHGRLPQDDPVARALLEPGTTLQTALRDESIPEDTFWSHLIPLAALYPTLHDLAEVSLHKTIGAEKTAGHVQTFAGYLEDIKIAFTAAVGNVSPDLMAMATPLKQAWDYHGAGLLGRATNWTDPALVVDEATVYLVHPTRTGGGIAHLQYNLVTFEPVSPAPFPDLPEILRLAWLLSTLNLDLPRFSENILMSRLPTVAGLAMVPVILSAAQELELGQCNQEIVSRALQIWIPEAADKSATVWDWWDGYTSMRPNWPTALAALDRLILT